MDVKNKLVIGIILLVIGCTGTLFGVIADLSSFSRIVNFSLGFLSGITAAMGFVLTLVNAKKIKSGAQ